MTVADDAWEQMRRERETERRQLAEVQGVTIPVMPPRLPGEDDKTYGCRIAWIAKSHCGPPPRPKLPPKRMVKSKQPGETGADRGRNGGDVGEIDKMPPTDLLQNSYETPTDPDGERLAGMTADLTTEDDP